MLRLEHFIIYCVDINVEEKRGKVFREFWNVGVERRMLKFRFDRQSTQ